VRHLAGLLAAFLGKSMEGHPMSSSNIDRTFEPDEQERAAAAAMLRTGGRRGTLSRRVLVAELQSCG